MIGQIEILCYMVFVYGASRLLISLLSMDAFDDSQKPYPLKKLRMAVVGVLSMIGCALLLLLVFMMMAHVHAINKGLQRGF